MIKLLHFSLPYVCNITHASSQPFSNRKRKRYIRDELFNRIFPTKRNVPITKYSALRNGVSFLYTVVIGSPRKSYAF